MPTTTKLPTKRRKYHKIYAPTAGLKYDLASTMIGETNTPSCNEVILREGKVSKTTGTTYFAQTNTIPLSGTVMHIDQYYKSDGSEKLMCHTTTDVYYYNTVTDLFVPLSRIYEPLVCRTTVLRASSKNLVCRVTRA